MDFMKALQYPFEDEEWMTKVLIGVLITLVPILNFASFGYLTEIIRGVAHGEERPLKSWDNLGDFFMKGLYYMIAGLVYVGVPMIIGFIIMTPIGFLPLLAGESDEALAALGTVTGLGMGCVALLMLIVSLVTGFLLTAGLLRFSTGSQELREFFQFKENWDLLRNNLGTFIIAYLYILGASIVISLIVMCVMAILGWIPCIGQLASFVIGLPLSFYITLFMGHIFGQAAREMGLPLAAE